MAFFFLILFGILAGIGIVHFESVSLWIVPGLFLTGLAFLIRPLWLIALLLAVPTFRIVWRAGGIAPLEMAYSLIFLSLLIRLLLKESFASTSTHDKSDFRSPMRTPLFIFLLLACVSAVVAVLRNVPFGFWASDLNMILFYAFYFVVIGHIREPEDFNRLLHFLFWVTFAAVIYSTYPRIRESGFTVTLYGEPVIKVAGASAFSLHMFLILLSMLLSMKQKGWRRWMYLFLCFFFGTHQLLATVRSRWLGALAAVGLIFLVSLPPQRAILRRFFFSLVFAVSLLVTASLTVPPLYQNPALWFTQQIQKRFVTIFRGREDPTTEVRLVEWKAAMGKARQFPWFGNGLGTEITFVDTSTRVLPLQVTSRYIHNSYIFYLLNMGAAGLLAFLWLCLAFVGYGVKVFRATHHRYYKGMVLGFWASFVAMGVVGFAGATFSDPALTIWAGFFMGAVTVMDQQKERMRSLPR